MTDKAKEKETETQRIMREIWNTPDETGKTLFEQRFLDPMMKQGEAIKNLFKKKSKKK